MFAMHPQYVREKAIKLRVERHMSIVEIADRLALPKTTIYYWVRDIPLGRPRRENPGQRRGNRRMVAKYKQLRDASYARGRGEFLELTGDPLFRDFVCMYIAEGYKRSRSTVSLSNSDPAVIRMAAHWLRTFSKRPVSLQVSYHADQDPEKLRAYWSSVVPVDPGMVRMQPKTNSGRLGSRTWRCQHGVADVRTHDTLFRARLQAWMDCLQESWLDSAASGA